MTRGVTATWGADYRLTYTPGYPVLVNDATMSHVARQAALLVHGAVATPEPRAGASGTQDDFARMLERVPGCMVGLGVRTPAVRRCGAGPQRRLPAGRGGAAGEGGLVPEPGAALRAAARARWGRRWRGGGCLRAPQPAAGMPPDRLRPPANTMRFTHLRFRPTTIAVSELQEGPRSRRAVRRAAPERMAMGTLPTP